MKDYVVDRGGLMVPRHVAMADGLRNLVSGLGTSKAKRSHNTFAMDVMTGFGQLDAAYQTNWIARSIVDIPAEDMTREWRTVKCKDAEEIARVEDDLGMPGAVQEGLCWARLYGGGAVLAVTNQDLEKPLNLKSIKKGDLERFVVFDRWELSAANYNNIDPLKPNFLMPEHYTVASAGGQRIHWSHLALFFGARLPRRLRQLTQGWGDSELRKCLDDIKDTVAGKDGIAELMQECNIDVITRTGLADELASDQDSKIQERYELYSLMKSLVNMALLDGDETFQRMTLNLSGVAPILETFMTWISGAADIPVTRLFGTSAKGMNATGEGDMANYFNSIRSKQGSQLANPMRTLDEIMVRSALGFWPDDFSYQWNPLEQQNAVEIAQAEYMRAQKNQIYLDQGVLRVSQVQKVLRANEEYQFADGAIEELEKLEAEDPFAGGEVDGSNQDPDLNPGNAEPSENVDK